MGTESFLRSEIFFFITSISVIIFTVIFIIFSFYLIKIMKNFSDISARFKKTVDDASSDISEIGQRINESSLFTFIFGKKKRTNKK